MWKITFKLIVFVAIAYDPPFSPVRANRVVPRYTRGFNSGPACKSSRRIKCAYVEFLKRNPHGYFRSLRIGCKTLKTSSSRKRVRFLLLRERERKKKPYQSYRIASRLVNRDRVLAVRDESERERWKIRAPSEPVGRRGITRCNGNQAQPLTADWVYTNHRPPMEAIILICWPSIEPRSPPRSRIIKVARRRERERE